MSLFADFSPEPIKAGISDTDKRLTVREAADADISALAQIAAEREGTDPSSYLEFFRELLRQHRETGRALMLVARLDEEIVGYGKATYFVPAPHSPPDVAPEGWYLSGVVVAPNQRRKGIGDCLTRMRLEWIAQRSSCAYYFANARNSVSIALHRRFGFVELTRCFSFPGVTFQGGVGILFKIELQPPAEGP